MLRSLREPGDRSTDAASGNAKRRVIGRFRDARALSDQSIRRGVPVADPLPCVLPVRATEGLPEVRRISALMSGDMLGPCWGVKRCMSRCRHAYRVD